MVSARTVAYRFWGTLGGLLLFGLAVGGLPGGPPTLLNPLPHVTQSSSAVDVSQSEGAFDTLRTVARHVFRRTNTVRDRHDLSSLRRDSMLAQVACAHNADMFRRDFFRHVNPDGDSPQDRVSKRHRRLVGGVSENLYSQDRIRKAPKALATQMVRKWMDSPPHRKNILTPSVTHLGVCVLRRGSSLRATQLFSRVVGHLAAPLPRTVARGTVLPISFDQTFPAGTKIARYDFWAPRTDRRISGPTIFADTLRIPDTTGTVSPRFHILGTDEYVLYRGPDLTIVDSSGSHTR